jgi:hypothetical protein
LEKNFVKKKFLKKNFWKKNFWKKKFWKENLKILKIILKNVDNFENFRFKNLNFFKIFSKFFFY